MCGIRTYFTAQAQQKDAMHHIQTAQSIKKRWPDATTIKQRDHLSFCFHRLAIMWPWEVWNQPFSFETEDSIYTVICNGEIYNYQDLASKYDIHIVGWSDCSILPQLFAILGPAMVTELDWEFAYIVRIYDKKQHTTRLHLARDPFGVRPLFWCTDGKTYFAACSEMKWLLSFDDDIHVFDPRTYMTVSFDVTGVVQHKSTTYYDLSFAVHTQDEKTALKKVRESFYSAVKKRLHADRPVACLTSWWLDSSLVSAVSADILDGKLETYTIGMQWGTDLAYAKKVADHIWSQHQTFLIEPHDALDAIRETIVCIESFDCTTVRASTFQYLLWKKISELTQTKVLLTWEGSDESTGGYLYFHKAPDLQSFDAECKRLLEDIHLYDWLRVDRAMSHHGLEIRIPFLDQEFVQTYLSIDAGLRIPQQWYEKYLLRKAFEGTWLLPDDVLWRKKEAFSDGVSDTKKSRFQMIQDYIASQVSQSDFEMSASEYVHCTPDTLEKYFYRKTFDKIYWQQCESTIPYQWMPRRSWQQTDPSARVLDVY